MEIKLTEFSRGAGCGCKIAPAVLDEILQSQMTMPDNRVLVGNNSKDDAAAYDIGNGMALISTTDFFMPVVDDAYDFGQIASANAISDVYAMGGKPIMALAILGWPVDKIPASYAQRVIEGARAKCAEAGIALAGGHSIDSAEPIFGLAVSGIAPINNLKRNNTSKEGDLVFLTKPLGTGILSTAMKRGVLADEHKQSFVAQMNRLNKLGELLGQEDGVHAMTDVTGFGLLGHLYEMCEGSNLSAEICYNNIPAADGVKSYLSQGIIPDATYRNWNNYGKHTGFAADVNMSEAFSLLPDPQTNGGLLLSVAPGSVTRVQALLKDNHLENHLLPIGKFVSRNEKTIFVGIGDCI